VNVIWRDDDTPSRSETRCRSDWLFASSQSGDDTVYSSHCPSGLGAGEPALRKCCMSRKVMAR
jgi:hypothetical protein